MRICKLFEQGRPLFSFEFFPPKTEAGDVALRATIAELRELAPDFVSVTYGAGGTTRERTIELVAYIRQTIGLEAMAHLTCVGSDRAEMAAVLDRIENAGVENIIALRGDPPKGETEFRPHPNGFAYASELIHMVRSEGRPFCIAAACYPETHPEADSPEADLAALVQKVEAGAEFLITQLFLDSAVYRDFVARARAAGIDVPIIAGVMPLTNLAQAERFGTTVPDALRERLERVRHDDDAVAREMIEYTTDLCIDVLEAGAPGIHFYTLNKSPLTREILQRLRRRI